MLKDYSKSRDSLLVAVGVLTLFVWLKARRLTERAVRIQLVYVQNWLKSIFTNGLGRKIGKMQVGDSGQGIDILFFTMKFFPNFDEW